MVSVVIPTRNDAAMLAACLDLLSRQTRPADEIIVVDNASSDNTAAVCSAAGVRRILVDVPGIPATTAAGFDGQRETSPPGWTRTPGPRRIGWNGWKPSWAPRAPCPW
jgi:glycosyltransferase involved in cell wall biosynthesis